MDIETIDSTVGQQPKKIINKHETLYKELKILIEGYKGGLMALSLKIQVSKPTLWRWVNLKNSRAPSPHNVLSLLKFLKKRN